MSATPYVRYVEPAACACGASFHPDCFGPDGRCVDCWERDLPPSQRRPALTQLTWQVLEAMSDRYGNFRARTSYPAWPWVQRPCRALTSDGAVDLSADGPRALLRRVRRHLRRATNTATAMETP